MPRIRLEDASLRSLTPPLKGQTDYWDTKLPGFGVRVSQGGSKTFVLNMHKVRRTIGRYPLVSLSEARTEAKRMLAEKTLGKVRPQSITFEAAKKLFLDEKRKSRRSRTVNDLEARLNRHFLFKGQLADCDHEEVARRLRKIKSNSEHDHALAVAKTFFTWCTNRRYISDNPTRGLSPHGHKSRSRVLSDAELQLVWEACSRHAGQNDTNKAIGNIPLDGAVKQAVPSLPNNFATIVQLLILTGQRRGEIAALRADYISNDTCTFPASLTKNGREHCFPIGSLTQTFLATATSTSHSNHLLFPARGATATGARPFNGWSKSKASLDKLSGVTGWTLHDLRRTFRTNLGKLGVAPHIAERLVNHISSRTEVEKIYDLHQYLPEMREAMSRWEKHLSTVLQLG